MTDHNDPDEGRRVWQGRLPAPAVPERLHDRVRTSLRAEGLIRPARRLRWGFPLALAAACGTFFLGLHLGGQPVKPASPQFALLLYDTSQPSHPTDGVAEHRAWAAQVAASGHAISGEAFDAAERDVERGAVLPASDQILSGFFIVSAHDEAEAVAIARTSPHFLHHGRIVVRAILHGDDTGRPR